jgi:hypothetical protein
MCYEDSKDLKWKLFSSKKLSTLLGRREKVFGEILAAIILQGFEVAK